MAAPAAVGGDRCGAQRPPPLSRQESGLSEAIQRSREVLSTEPLASNLQQASLAHILGGKHDGQEPCGVARQPRLRVGAVIGRHRSSNIVSATLVNGHTSGVPWLYQGRATSGAGTSIPTARNRLLRNGPELGDAGVVQTPVPRPRPDVHGPPSPAGLGISRVLGSAGSSRTANWGGGRSPCTTESRRGKNLDVGCVNCCAAGAMKDRRQPHPVFHRRATAQPDYTRSRDPGGTRSGRHSQEPGTRQPTD